MIPTFLLTISFILTIAGLFSYYGWWFDLASHFRVQYFFLQLLCVFLCMPKKKWKLLGISLIAALINFSFILPFYYPYQPPAKMAPRPSKDISILLINLNSHNNAFDKVANFIEQTNPDILALEEINDKWIDGLESTLKRYPFQKVKTRPDNFGIALYSKLKSKSTNFAYFGSTKLPSILSQYSINNKPVTLLFTHSVPPVTLKHYHWRNEQLNDILAMKDTYEKNLILVGDLNVTSFSDHFNFFINRMDLVDTRLGRGLQISWPAMLPIMGISIDHILVSKTIRVLERLIGPDVGSDHYPVFIKLRIS